MRRDVVSRKRSQHEVFVPPLALGKQDEGDGTDGKPRAQPHHDLAAVQTLTVPLLPPASLFRTTTS